MAMSVIEKGSNAKLVEIPWGKLKVPYNSEGLLAVLVKEGEFWEHGLGGRLKGFAPMEMPRFCR